MSEAQEKATEQEVRIAKMFGARRSPQSGGGAWKLGDVLSTDWLVECKTTTTPKDSYSVRKDILDKADHERAEMHKSYFALAITLGEQYDDYFVLSKKTMQGILSQQQGIKNLLAAKKDELQKIEEKFAAIKLGDDPNRQPSSQLEALFLAHKQELVEIIKSLEMLE